MGKNFIDPINPFKEFIERNWSGEKLMQLPADAQTDTDRKRVLAELEALKCEDGDKLPRLSIVRPETEL